MGQLNFVKLNKKPIDHFCCGNNSIEEKIKNSYFITMLQHAYSYEISSSGKVLGYYMLLFRKIMLNECPDEICDYNSGFMNYCISLHIDYLAISKPYQHKKIGTNVLKLLISDIIIKSIELPIRLITIDALKEYYDWYIANGFVAFNQNDYSNQESTIRMYIDCLSETNRERLKLYAKV